MRPFGGDLDITQLKQYPTETEAFESRDTTEVKSACNDTEYRQLDDMEELLPPETSSLRSGSASGGFPLERETASPVDDPVSPLTVVKSRFAEAALEVAPDEPQVIPTHTGPEHYVGESK